MLLLVSVAYLTLLAVAFQDEIDRWFIGQWPGRRFETFSCGSRGRIDEGMSAGNKEPSMTLLLVDDDDLFRERLARALRDRDRILSDTGGNISEAARRLRIARRTLQLKRGRQRRPR